MVWEIERQFCHNVRGFLSQTEMGGQLKVSPDLQPVVGIREYYFPAILAEVYPE